MLQTSTTKHEQFFKTNPNTLYGMDENMLRILTNGNCQFVLDLSRELQLGYSVPCLALHISHTFFSKMCYINYDRFLVLTASLLIALKVKDICIPIKKICNAFYNVVLRITKNPEPYSEKRYELIREELCKTEGIIFRVLEYNMDYRLPLEYVEKYCKELIHEKKVNKVYFSCRVLIIDSYRTFCSMLFNPLVIFVSALLIACRYQKINFLENCFVQGQPGITTQSTEEELYYKFLQAVSKNEDMEVKPEDVRDCLMEMNRLFQLVHRYESQQVMVEMIS